MNLGHKIKKKIKIEKFLDIIQKYQKEDIVTTNHTFFRLNEKQREIYDEKKLKEILFDIEPFLAGIQNNGLWALFYKYQKKIFKIIADLQLDKIYIVTFYNIDKENIPRI